MKYQPSRTLSKLDIIRLAGCHECGARPGQPCIFARKDDRWGHRAAANQSHLDRIQRARKNTSPALDASSLNL